MIRRNDEADVTLESLTRVLVTLTLVDMMLAVGLGTTFSDIVGVFRRWRFLGRALAANYLCVPAATIGLLLLFDAQPLVIAGFLILAVCPGAPFGPPCTALAGGNIAAAVGLMVILAGSSTLLAPILLGLLMPLLAGKQQAPVDPAAIVSALLVTQLVPLSIGLLIRARLPRLANVLKAPTDKASAALSAITFGLILYAQFPALREIRLVGFGGMLALLAASLASGWLLGGPAAGDRRALALTTSLRNVGVGLVIATRAFPGSPAVIAVVAYGIIEIIGSLIVALWWRRSSGRLAAATVIRTSGNRRIRPGR